MKVKIGWPEKAFFRMSLLSLSGTSSGSNVCRAMYDVIILSTMMSLCSGTAIRAVLIHRFVTALKFKYYVSVKVIL